MKTVRVLGSGPKAGEVFYGELLCQNPFFPRAVMLRTDDGMGLTVDADNGFLILPDKESREVTHQTDLYRVDTLDLPRLEEFFIDPMNELPQEWGTVYSAISQYIENAL